MSIFFTVSFNSFFIHEKMKKNLKTVFVTKKKLSINYINVSKLSYL